jgi:hypothetical protein
MKHKVRRVTMNRIRKAERRITKAERNTMETRPVTMDIGTIHGRRRNNRILPSHIMDNNSLLLIIRRIHPANPAGRTHPPDNLITAADKPATTGMEDREAVTKVMVVEAIGTAVTKAAEAATTAAAAEVIAATVMKAEMIATVEDINR